VQPTTPPAGVAPSDPATHPSPAASPGGPDSSASAQATAASPAQVIAATAQPRAGSTGSHDATRDGSHAATAAGALKAAAEADPASAQPAGASLPGSLSEAVGQLSPSAPQPAGPAGAPARIATPVNLQRAVDAVTATIELAARQGATQARIQLAPPSLGALNIHLQRTPDGLLARVVADHAVAAQTLQQGSDDLRRSLESAGMTLLRLDIEASGQRGARAGHDSTPGSRNGTRADVDDITAEESGPVTSTIQLGASALVNVLA
jgi:flagellar hook-length control protein FliK